MPRAISVMDRSIYIHQFNYGTQLASWPAIVARCRAAGFNLIKLKALDGPDWMGTYDLVPTDPPSKDEYGNVVRVAAPNAVTSAWQWEQLAAEVTKQGGQLIPWCVPHGVEPEMELAALDQLANYSGKLLELDLEPYSGFWQAARPALVDLVKSLFDRAIEVWVDVDIRPYAASALPLTEIAPYVTRWLSQSYWTTFQIAARSEIQHDADLFAGLPSGDWGAILPAAGYQQFQAAAELAAERDASEIGLWSYNVAAQVHLDAFRGIV